MFSKREEAAGERRERDAELWEKVRLAATVHLISALTEGGDRASHAASGEYFSQLLFLLFLFNPKFRRTETQSAFKSRNSPPPPLRPPWLESFQHIAREKMGGKIFE